MHGIDIAKALRAAGHESYLVGGCVRDALLGRPAKDVDVATSARPAQVARLFPDAHGVGATFGVMLVGREQIEVATFRSDGTYSDGRRPDSVIFATARDDAERRDFTINALFQDPISGQIIDFVGGQKDLENGVIRAVGNPHERIAEDRLRMLRAVRFAARFGFDIERETMAAIRANSASVTDVAAERIQSEITKILIEGGARHGFELLRKSGLLEHVLPEVFAMQGVDQPPEHHPEGDVWLHTLGLLEHLPENPSAALAWAALLHDVGKPPTFQRVIGDRIRFDGHDKVGAKMADAIARRLRFSTERREQVVSMVRQHMRFMALPNMRPAKAARFVLQDEFADLHALHRLDCLSSGRSLRLFDLAAEIAQKQAENPAPRLLTGRDLIAAGFHPGPLFGIALRAVEDAILARRIETKQQALAVAARFF